MLSSTLINILIATSLGSILSILIAGLFVYIAKPQWINLLISYAVGALLGAVFLELIPEAIELSHDHHNDIFTVMLIGIVLFFGLEKAVLWRHNHDDFDHLPEVQKENDNVCTGHHTHHRHASGLMITIGDSVHNFVDGVVIAGAFLVSPQVGITTSIAIIAHEIPQEVGDFLVLLHSGYSKKKAILMNLLASLSMIIGAVLSYFVLEKMNHLLPYLISFACASMIYVAVADLIPNLHRKNTAKTSILQFGLVILGILGSSVGHLFFEHSH